ncbi:ABC transporter permease [Winogradskyella maritima]|uniref:ABC transporter permease n=1 Tax=Winogradskyella maritima TaxID=1517766 RepID=A0ABV8AG60_9FLAO|nr:ABC transporter permease [Winogradskyella maritima]
MLRHTILIAIRSIKKNKTSFLINIIGLSSGLASVILICLWINDELSVDAFHENKENIHQVITNLDWENKIITMENSPLLLADALTEEFPEVKSATSTSADFMEPSGVIQYEDRTKVGTGIFASENFFDTFSFNLLYGNKNEVLSRKDNIVISESLAKSLFANPQSAIGKTLVWDYKWSDGGRKRTLSVSGVFEDVKNNSTLTFDALLPAKSMVDDSRWAGDWSGGYAHTYLVLDENADVDELNDKIAKFLTTKLKDRDNFELFTQQFSSTYLNDTYENGVLVGGRIFYVRLFAFIALFILIIACINFMNLATAQASKRIKEIGIKKVVGGRKRGLIFQFLGESIFLTILATLFACILSFLVLPYFNNITGKSILFKPSFALILGIIGLAIVTGVLAGSYPAFYLSRFKPVSILKGRLNTVAGEVWVRKGLVVFQFSLAVIFIISVFIINRQIDFMMDKNLGYDKENVITFKLKTDYKNRDVLMNELEAMSAVTDVAFMSGSLLESGDGQGGYSWRGVDSDKKVMFKAPRIGYNYIETLGIGVLDGRTFSKEFNDDESKIIINESALRFMNLEPSSAIGTIIDHGSGQKEIIGVVKDFQYGSLHNAVEPLILRFRRGGTDMALRIKTAEVSAVLNEIETIYERLQPGYPFEFSFLDSEYQNLYESENRVASLSKIATLLVVLISCLGLFGLVMFTAQQRRKEIGIRKVLGASVTRIVMSLSKDFLKLVFISILISMPIAWFVMNNWLQDFAYRVALDWKIFLISSLIIVFIAFITISFQAIKAANTNPVKSLKTE